MQQGRERLKVSTEFLAKAKVYHQVVEGALKGEAGALSFHFKDKGQKVGTLKCKIELVN